MRKKPNKAKKKPVVSATKTDIHKKGALAALKKSLGNVTYACQKTKIARSTFYQWMKEDKKFKEDVDEISEMSLDFTEGKLMELVDSLNPTAIIFYLKTKGKKRGYCEKEAESDEKPIIWSETKIYKAKDVVGQDGQEALKQEKSSS